MKYAIYEKKRHWKAALLVIAIIIGFSSLLYTNSLVKQLSHEEMKKVQLWAEAYNQVLFSEDEDQDLTFESEVIKTNETIPVILVDNDHNIIAARNLDTARMNDRAYLERELQIMRGQHHPIIIEYGDDLRNYIYYKNSYLVTQLRYYPYIQLFIISLFLLVSYLAFSSSRRYEQNKVWVGMSKETAHQLGTPLSSLMAWNEYLRENPEAISQQVIDEMDKDIQRLMLVTDRFSKIGSIPSLKEDNIYQAIRESVAYLETRLPKKIKVEIDPHADKDAIAPISKPLFDWVIENITKNAANAMEKGEGIITFYIEDRDNEVLVDIRDTGKGIVTSHFKTIFNPGFTTRKRGWGLGLSLAKRIIETYHGGQIFVKESEVGKGSTFRIRLMKNKEPHQS